MHGRTLSPPRENADDGMIFGGIGRSSIPGTVWEQDYAEPEGTDLDTFLLRPIWRLVAKQPWPGTHAGPNADRECFGSVERSQWIEGREDTWLVHGLLEDEVDTLEEGIAIIEAETVAELRCRTREVAIEALARQRHAEEYRDTACVVTECGCYFAGILSRADSIVDSELYERAEMWTSRALFVPEFFRAIVYETRHIAAAAAKRIARRNGGEIRCAHSAADRFARPRIGVLR